MGREGKALVSHCLCRASSSFSGAERKKIWPRITELFRLSVQLMSNSTIARAMFHIPWLISGIGSCSFFPLLSPILLLLLCPLDSLSLPPSACPGVFLASQVHCQRRSHWALNDVTWSVSHSSRKQDSHCSLVAWVAPSPGPAFMSGCLESHLRAISTSVGKTGVGRRSGRIWGEFPLAKTKERKFGICSTRYVQAPFCSLKLCTSALTGLA